MDKVKYGILFGVGIVLFYSGMQTAAAEHKFWLVLKEMFSILANIATVLGVLFAYDAYRSWKRQIVLPKQYESDELTLKNLKDIHETVDDFIKHNVYVVMLSLQSLRELDKSSTEQTIQFTDESNFIRKTILNSEMLDLPERFNCKVKDNCLSVFNVSSNIPKPILDYENSLKTYVDHLRTLIYSNPFESAKKQSYNLTDLEENSKLHKDLVKAYSIICQYYSSKWH